MSDRELYRCLVQAATDKEFRFRMTRDPEEVLKGFELSDTDRDALIAKDERLFEMFGRVLRANDFTNEYKNLPEPVEKASELQEIKLPPINLTLHVRPYAQQGTDGQLIVNYAADILTGQELSPEKRPPGVQGQPLTSLELKVHADVRGIQNVSKKEFRVRYDVVAEQSALTPDSDNNNEEDETSPIQPELSMRRAPNPWGHRVKDPDVDKAAETLLSVPTEERFTRLEKLVRKLTGGSSSSEIFPISPSGSPDIWIVGLGMKAGVQVTQETCDVLSRVEEVLFVDTGVGTREYLESLCPRVRSLFMESYGEADNRLTAYQHMAISVIEAALDHKPVAFAMQGHPIVGSYAPVLIYDLAVCLGLVVRVLPGLSHLDALFSELLLDPFIQGVQAYEATDLLLRSRPLCPDVPALLFQVGNVETRLYTERVSRPERMKRLRQHLERYYSAKHQIQAVYASPHPLAPSAAYTFELAHISDYSHVIHPGFTLFIPPVAERPITDPILVQQIDSPAHLHKITRE